MRLLVYYYPVAVECGAMLQTRLGIYGDLPELLAESVSAKTLNPTCLIVEVNAWDSLEVALVHIHFYRQIIFEALQMVEAESAWLQAELAVYEQIATLESPTLRRGIQSLQEGIFLALNTQTKQTALQQEMHNTQADIACFEAAIELLLVELNTLNSMATAIVEPTSIKILAQLQQEVTIVLSHLRQLVRQLHVVSQIREQLYNQFFAKPSANLSAQMATVLTYLRSTVV